MFSFITSIPISRRIFYAFLLAAVVPAITIVALSAVFVSSLHSRSITVGLSINSANSATDARESLANISEALATYRNLPNDKNLENVHFWTNDFDGLIKQYGQRYDTQSSPPMSGVYSTLVSDGGPGVGFSTNQHTAFVAAQKSWPNYKNAQDQLLADMKAGTQVTKDEQAVTTGYKALTDSWDNVELNAEKVTDSLVGTGSAGIGSSQVNFIIMAAVIAFLITLVTVIVIGSVMNLTITRPLRHLITLTKRIAKGETSARANLSGQDEISVVADSMNNMLDNIVRLIQETQSQRDGLQGQVEKLVREVSGVGEGDLRVQAEVTADALGVLADSFNYMVDELGSLVVRVKLVSHEVQNSTTTILKGMTHLARAGDSQISQVAETATELQRVADASRQVAERSQILYDVARQARLSAQSGRQTLQQAVRGMGRINENVQATANKVQNLGDRSREINDILEAISSIAHQTNRLALDAAIQAAMAGENGKGFGAVAADIRRLAERAKDQVGMIGRIVRSVRDDIAAVAISMQDTERETSIGTRLTQETGVALEAIFSAVEHQAKEIEGIHLLGTQQLQSSNAVVQIMQGLTNAIQQDSVGTHDASLDMERLASLVEQLRVSVEAFKLRENQEYLLMNSANDSEFGEMTDDQMSVSAILRSVNAGGEPRYPSTPMIPQQSGLNNNGLWGEPQQDQWYDNGVRW